MTAEIVYLALGSNLGDRQAHLDSAVSALREIRGLEVLRVSRVVETPALLAHAGASAQPLYLNQVVEASCSLEPDGLLSAVRAIEANEGRVRRERWSSRTLDIDIVLFGERIVDTPELTVPHPEMTRRAFVLGPLRELSPALRHPVNGLSIEALWRALSA
ncbi:MAG: 2-amino-4-hydroxy-6-hydroxymethyldihydropteridine diphosphokinase [Myxococcaceae bacterium]|nr:2-amino-4-hydroxy-6-hydroxymethyldihydropteridine diphosphokinase [Myxococcaceae bacterium]